jgi:uncharacterized protein YukE
MNRVENRVTDRQGLEARMLVNIHRLASLDASTADLPVLRQVLESVRDLRSFISSVELTVTRRTNELHRAGQAGSAEGLLAGSGGQSARDAKAAKDRADVADAMPLFDTALQNGAVDPGHLDAIARAQRGLSDAAKAELAKEQERLLAAAEGSSVDAFGRTVADVARAITAELDALAEADRLTRLRNNSRVKRWIDADGMHNTLISLDPVRDAQLDAALQAQLASLRQRDGSAETGREQLKVDAFMELVTTAGTFKDGHSADVTVIIDWQTLTGGIHDLSVCETSSGVPLPVATIQKLCCDATIHLVTVDEGRVPLNVGMSVRTATRAQRRALAAIHTTCAHPDCSVSVNHCQFHHIIPWEQNGPTDLDNLIPLCSRHHHLVHEGMWTIRLKPDRTIVWTQPNGDIYFDGHTTDRIPTRPPDREH